MSPDPRDGSRKPRVTYIVRNFPALSQSYIHSEIEALADDYEISVITRRGPEVAREDHHPYRVCAEPEAMCEAIEELRPDVLHSHWLFETPLVARVSAATGVPYTIRSHSFDLLWGGPRGIVFGRLPWGVKASLPGHLKQAARVTHDDACLGVLAFPFARPRLEKAGFPRQKLRECWPVMSYDRFYDRSPNEPGVMNTGAAIAKKDMFGFLDLATRVEGVPFHLYPLGRLAGPLAERNRELGDPVTVVPPVQTDDMPAEYKRHTWLVYLGDKSLRAVGWPVSIAEAQASGVGIVMSDLRPDLHEYVGPGGFICKSLDEAARVVSQPYPDEMREAGFEHAEKSDIARHKTILTDLWASTVGSAPAVKAS